MLYCLNQNEQYRHLNRQLTLVRNHAPEFDLLKHEN